MNRSYQKFFVSARGKMLSGVVMVAALAMSMFVVCGGDSDGGGIGKYCYFPPSSYNNNTSSCNEIGTKGATGAAVSIAACEADYGYVIDNCAHPPVIQYCDFGEPVTWQGEEFGGCHAIPSNQTPATYCPAGEGEIVATCPPYGPAQPGIECDFGFGNRVPMSRARCNANPDGVIAGEVEPFYCDFGQPSMYGAGGCYVRFAEWTGGYEGIQWYPEDPEYHAGCDPWAARVSLIQCITSNSSNGCVADPVLPHIPPAEWANSPCCASDFPEFTAAEYAATCGSLPGAQL